jgi:hypothetical protein
MLGVFAHPDDELIFGWPVLDELDGLLIVSNNHNSYPNAWRATEEICRDLNIPCWTVGLDNNFYRLPTRRADLTLPQAVEKVNAGITSALRETQSKRVFTHNQWGEYGHGDHRLVHDIVIRHPGMEYVWVSDMCQANKCHLSTEEPPKRITVKLGPPIRMRCQLDRAMYERGKRVYETHSAWSWYGHSVHDTCNLYTI